MVYDYNLIGKNVLFSLVLSQQYLWVETVLDLTSLRCCGRCQVCDSDAVVIVLRGRHLYTHPLLVLVPAACKEQQR